MAALSFSLLWSGAVALYASESPHEEKFNVCSGGIMRPRCKRRMSQNDHLPRLYPWFNTNLIQAK